MLQKSHSKKTALLKYLMVLPLIITMLTYVSCTKDDTFTNTEAQNTKVNGNKVQFIVLSVEDLNNLSASENKNLSQKLKNALNNDKPLNIILTDGDKEKTILVNSGNMTIPPTPSSEGVSYAEIEIAPAYSGCDQSKEDVKNCTSNKIQEFVNTNFNIDVAEDLNLEGNNRVYVQFSIAKDGQVKT